jgi:pyruvate/2-oxoglutarate dehydrogenase complex dihydrolipoamide acyltransferase (E2) component
MARLAAQTGKKLLPEDVDRFLATIGAGSDKLAFDEVDVPANQRTLVFRLQRGAQGVIPATLEMAAEWSRIESVAAALRRDQGEAAPSKFVLFAWCVAQAAKGHAAFRSSVPSDSALRRYKHLHLGIAVARAEDELLIARVEAVDALAFPEFVASAREAIERARAGEDQAADPMQIILTNLARTGARFGTPVLAAPSVATIYAGAPYDEAYPLQGGGVGFRRIAHLVMTFDHRAANGMGAAAFLGEVRQRCEDFELQGVSST